MQNFILANIYTKKLLICVNVDKYMRISIFASHLFLRVIYVFDIPLQMSFNE